MTSLPSGRTAIATGLTAATALAIGLAWTHPWDPTPRPGPIYLPRVSQRAVPPPQPPQPPRTVLRPADAGALIDAITVPGALVLPEAGRYALPVQARVAAGVTINGRDRVLITGHGLMLEDAHGAELHRLDIRGVKGDGLTATRSLDVLLDGLDVANARDGLLDLNGGATVTVVDTFFHDNIRGVLCGNWQAPKDGRERLTLVRVRFERVRVRTPKAQDCDVVAQDLTVVDAVEWPVDARGSSVVVIDGFEWSGKKINPPAWRAGAGATVEVVD